jgi:hypothetical protein
MTRVTSPVDDRTLKFVMKHAAELGLPAGASQAIVISRVIELGARQLGRQLRDRARDELYTAWADDPERADATAFHERAADLTGMY